MPDTSPGVPAPGAHMSREASAQAAAADAGRAGSPGPPVRTAITVPDSVSMVGLLGSADELLRLVEAEVDADVQHESPIDVLAPVDVLAAPVSGSAA